MSGFHLAQVNIGRIRAPLEARRQRLSHSESPVGAQMVRPAMWSISIRDSASGPREHSRHR
jgi:hypothetical protein